MTREEAMLKIGELGCYARANGWDDDYTEAVNIAIKALEQEPCEDAISRQAALDALRTCFDTDSIYDANNAIDYIDYEEAVNEIEALPSVEPILDKIRAEIEARLCDVVSDYTDGYITAIQGVLIILDKYKAESEEE